ncbi:hypothetical protein RPC_3990 [Rhodopseudomonas palustris BisB18]|uniref:Uncharacterized protein n=1 Tax=Rhodopseudomonas palustris (strain BisB18) TaxID=316056 RepID=Q20ZC0_RHOPB
MAAGVAQPQAGAIASMRSRILRGPRCARAPQDDDAQDDDAWALDRQQPNQRHPEEPGAARSATPGVSKDGRGRRAATGRGDRIDAQPHPSRPSLRSGTSG